MAEVLPELKQTGPKWKKKKKNLLRLQAEDEMTNITKVMARQTYVQCTEPLCT
jgi:hypothetical protein